MAEPSFSISATLPHPMKSIIKSSPWRQVLHSHLSPFSSTLRMKTRPALPLTFSCSTPAPVKTQKKKNRQGHQSTPRKEPVFSEGRDLDDGRLVCPGCGVFMQDADPNLPGYFQERPVPKEEEVVGGILDEEGSDEEEIVGYVSISDLDEEMSDFESEDGFSDEEKTKVEVKGKGDEWDFDWDSDWDVEDEDVEEISKKELDGFGPAGVGYGNVTVEILEKRKKEKISKAERKKIAREARKEEHDGATVCARCHSLRNYGQVKNDKVENLIPDFDFDRLVTASLMKPATSSPVVVMVVDCVDFDGSFPKRAAKSLFKTLEGIKRESKLTKLPKLVLVATKTDLLPSQISPTRLDRWVRNRAKANGAPKLSAVYLVSARKDIGVRNLLSFIKELSGPRGNVWVIGAQNAGKSTLINALAKREGVKITRLTEAAIPGTTLGILRIGGILPAKAKMYDTPGLLHPYLMSMRLNREEQKMVEIRKELQPRSYRVKAGQTVHVGGLARLDLTQASVQTIYITVWVSPNVSLHLGKTLNAEETWNKHVGIRLQPPIGQDRVSELGQWRERQIKVSGISWEANSLDVAIAGLGWFSIGLKGEATLSLWIFEGVEVTQREPLVIDRAPFLERPGFLLPKAISDALGNQSKLEAEAKKSAEEREDSLSENSEIKV